MIRLGLCCHFINQPIKFRTTTATHALKLSVQERLLKLSRLCLANAQALQQAAEFCVGHHIGCFRVNSQILPLKTHPQAGYDIRELADCEMIEQTFKSCGIYAKKHDLRFSFHPDQFVLLSSPRPEVTLSSLQELDYQAQISEWIGADVISIHGGGAYGDKTSALKRFLKVFRTLSRDVRNRLTLENDDRVYTPKELLPLCREAGIPFVYDVHHHRCLPDGLSVEAATEQALKTWNREPLFHISSPREGWKSRTPHYHHDYISLRDWPVVWQSLDLTVEVEAKAKELAIVKLYTQLQNKGLL
jgi:UV DNA damage endonuclease